VALAIVDPKRWSSASPRDAGFQRLASLVGVAAVAFSRLPGCRADSIADLADGAVGKLKGMFGS